MAKRLIFDRVDVCVTLRRRWFLSCSMKANSFAADLTGFPSSQGAFRWP